MNNVVMFRKIDIAFTKEQSNMLKGFAVILLLLHHYSGMGFAYDEFSVCKSLGPVLCSIFFFSSGYGLTIGKQSRSTVYWKKRFLTLLLPFWIANAIYLCYALIVKGENIPIWQGLSDLFGFTLINGHCWFLQALLLLYVCYFISVRYNHKYMIIKTLIGGVIFTLLNGKVFTLSWLAFPMGIYVAQRKLNVPIIALAIWLLSLLFTFYYYHVNHGYINTSFRLVNFLLMIMSVPALMVSLAKVKIPIGVLGQKSMSYYLVHGLVLKIIADSSINYKWLCLLLYVTIVIMAAWLFEHIHVHVLRILRLA